MSIDLCFTRAEAALAQDSERFDARYLAHLVFTVCPDASWVLVSEAVRGEVSIVVSKATEVHLEHVVDALEEGGPAGLVMRVRAPRQ